LENNWGQSLRKKEWALEEWPSNLRNALEENFGEKEEEDKFPGKGLIGVTSKKVKESNKFP